MTYLIYIDICIYAFFEQAKVLLVFYSHSIVMSYILHVCSNELYIIMWKFFLLFLYYLYVSKLFVFYFS